ncbi:MAG: fasciclin domain-containing protein [Bacteroidota bacterium]
MKFSVPALALLLSVTAVGCDSADTASNTTAAAVVLGDDDLVTFRYATSAVGILRDLAYDDQTFTVLAATNDAFVATSAEDGLGVDDILGRPDIQQVLNVHVIRDQVLMAADLSNGQQITTEAGATLRVVIDGERVGFDADGDGQADAFVEAADLTASNGVVHKVDGVFVASE